MDEEEMYRVNQMMEEMEEMNLPKTDPYQKSKQSQIKEALKLMESGLEFDVISSLTQLSRDEIDQIYSIYKPTIKDRKVETIDEHIRSHR